MSFRTKYKIPIDEEDRKAVITAYRKAVMTGKGPVDAYLAGVAAWQKRHLEHTHEYSAKQAIEIILTYKFSGHLADFVE